MQFLPCLRGREAPHNRGLGRIAGFFIAGTVYATTAERKRQVEFIAFLEHVDREVAQHITTIHVVLDNLRMHKGKQVQAWLVKHPRFVFHFPPVHCSWMNQVEQVVLDCAT